MARFGMDDEKSNAVIDPPRNVSKWRISTTCKKMSKTAKDGSTNGNGPVMEMCGRR